MTARNWEARGRWRDQHGAFVHVLERKYQCQWQQDATTIRYTRWHLSEAGAIDDAMDMAAEDSQERAAAERAKAEQQDCYCPKCSGIQAQPEATAARARSPVAALLDSQSTTLGYANRPVRCLTVEKLRDAIDQQCADWRADWPTSSMARHSNAYVAGYADALRRCADDLAGDKTEPRA